VTTVTTTLVPTTTGSATTAAPRAPDRASTVAVGLVVACAAVVMTFGALLLAYGLVRVQAPGWPPPGEPDLRAAMWPFLLGATAASALASGAMHVAGRRLTPGAGDALDQDRGRDQDQAEVRRSAAARPLTAAALSGAAFVVVQVLAGRHLLLLGARPSSGLVASVVYTLTAFHALHALGATLAISRLAWRAGRRVPTARSTVRAVAAFVHLVTALWLVIALAVFVL
jgi:heme/copper-type cytochrome/quinol oxidase subunit 3